MQGMAATEQLAERIRHVLDGRWEETRQCVRQEIDPAATVHTATESREFADGETAEVTVLRFE